VAKLLSSVSAMGVAGDLNSMQLDINSSNVTGWENISPCVTPSQHY
jgi:hypothetical protein